MEAKAQRIKEKEITLPSGSVAVIKRGKGIDTIEATKVAGGAQELYLPALISRVTKIDGKSLVLEDITELDADDYHALLAEVTDINF